MHGCTICIDKGNSIERRMTFATGSTLRTQESHALDIENYTNTGLRLRPNGVYGESALAKIYQLPTHAPIDVMHQLYLGVVPYLLNKLRSSELFEDFISFEQDFSNVELPAFFCRQPRPFNEGKFKAIEWKTALLYILPFSFEHFNEFAGYIFYALAIVTRNLYRPVSLHLVSDLQELVCYFNDSVSHLFGQVIFIHNVHAVSHLLHLWMTFGPVNKYSAFKYESALGQIAASVNGSRYVVHQIAARFMHPAPSEVIYFILQHFLLIRTCFIILVKFSFN